MAYTVKALAQLSGVSVRTLHFYDEIELLKPAYVGENGYRYYEEEQLYLLQQILFFRELGLDLREIQQMLVRKDFDRVAALREHRLTLVQRKEQVEQLLQTLDQTLDRMTKGRPMADSQIFKGFDPTKQAQYEAEIERRFGADHPALQESRKNVGEWSKAQWQASGREWDAICRGLAQTLEEGGAPEGPAAQEWIARHHRWLKRFWTPDSDSYKGMTQGYTGPEWAQAFAPYDSEHPRLATFLATAAAVFARTLHTRSMGER